MSLPDPETLPARQELVLEVLAGRWRCGENIWTFGKRHTKAVEALAAAGYVWWKAGIIEKTILVGLTEEGRAAATSGVYKAPGLR